jgi:glyoxylase-like metal-dependent hydrolase (beta-lactamase superfamily II)
MTSIMVLRRISIIFALFILTFSVVTFGQVPKYEVYAMKFASMAEPVPLSALVNGAPGGETVDAAFIYWLIKDGNGKNILVDAGFLSDVEQAKQSGIAGYIRPDSLLAPLCLKAADITDVILTHPHWDHMDGINLFPNAVTWIQKDDYGYLVGEAWQGGRNGGFNKRDVRKILELNLAGRVRFVNGDAQEIIPGIKVYTGSRHTFNSQYVLVKSGTERIILASDNVYSYYNLEHLESAPEHGTFDTVGYLNAMKRMKILASSEQLIVPGHDNLLFFRFPRITDRIIRIK